MFAAERAPARDSAAPPRSRCDATRRARRRVQAAGGGRAARPLADDGAERRWRRSPRHAAARVAPPARGTPPRWAGAALARGIINARSPRVERFARALHGELSPLGGGEARGGNARIEARRAVAGDNRRRRAARYARTCAPGRAVGRRAASSKRACRSREPRRAPGSRAPRGCSAAGRAQRRAAAPPSSPSERRSSATDDLRVVPAGRG
jgi:hypothetical protein